MSPTRRRERRSGSRHRQQAWPSHALAADEFKQFLDVAVTPCFPDGLTLLTGKGQFRESDGKVVQETSFVLVLLYPVDARKESNVQIEALRTLYKNVFQQESVLRVDDPRAVRVGF